MAELILKDIKTEGNAVFITSYPTVGVLALTSFMEDVEGVDGTHTFEKSFRYTIDGVHFSDWIALTFGNLSGLTLLPHQIVQFEFQYVKLQPLGDDQLEVNAIDVQFTQEAVQPQEMFDKTIFKRFFESTDMRILNWYVNVLNKLYQKGLIPDYLERNVTDNVNEDEDFLQFWGSIAKFFAYYVIYARQFQNFHESEVLLFDFLEQRGLKISDTTTLEQMNALMKDYYAEVLKRGTISVVDREEKGADIDGELLRLLWYKRHQDEFIFNPRLPQHIGWNLGNSSPLYRGLYLHDNANKAPEPQLYPNNIALYDGATLTIDEGHNILSVTSDTLSFIDKIKVDSNLDYQFSFLIKCSDPITVKLLCYDKDLNLIDTISYKDGSTNNTLLDEVKLYRGDKYLPINLFIYNSNKPLFSADTTEIHQGNDVKLHTDAVWVAPQITIDGQANIYGLRYLPLKTPYSHGIIQTNNVIDTFFVNNNNHFTFKQAHNHIVKYLIPYNSHLFSINIEDFNNIESQLEVGVRQTTWIGGDGYCEKLGWKGASPICETIATLWIGEEETAYCEQDPTTTSTTILTSTTTTAATTTTTTQNVISLGYVNCGTGSSGTIIIDSNKRIRTTIVRVGAGPSSYTATLGVVSVSGTVTAPQTQQIFISPTSLVPGEYNYNFPATDCSNGTMLVYIDLID